MFYFGEAAAIVICWLLYCEFFWMVQRKVRKVCSREYINKRCKTLFDRLFFTPVSGKAHLGLLYYANISAFALLCALTGFHLLLGWLDAFQGFIRVVTTVTAIILGAVAASSSAGSTEALCMNMNILSKKKILLLQIISFISEVLLILFYLYFAWVYIG